MEKKRKIEVFKYNENWTRKFREEVNSLKGILGEIAVNFHHIGSTAIPGIKAKPIIDIVVEVRDLEAVDQLNKVFSEKGYIPLGENGIVGRRFFIKGSRVERTHHIHIFLEENQEVERHIIFRDYMIAHPDEAEKYSKLKDELAQKHTYDVEEYINGKNQFIRDIDEKAEKWWNERI
ncbi:GrpB family protein [Alkaliphilus hydrothermalis]|uniref:GrpB-like predicted nucleotidyltransferase (UPF0157 family) n=1 Tax=Alkaliphilus hydrothermalis TaxID=1482730 RepID=A0ABS2NM99_9FIRM|nr:GrpB family protein [Alkaliphilus hydrothermalis]MBM7614058.1 GrpB-like predicted nucleotidyltransferase (UPF0157 family) [Alkaliphilus hydrothermalis]